MAGGDLIPPQIRNGGTSSPEVGNVNAPDYRQLQSAAQVRTDLPDSGAAARAAELQQTFKEFEGLSGDVYTKASLQAGALAGAAAGNTGSPQYKQGLERFTAYGRAFNNAATGAYAVEAEAQADDAAARLRVQANNNPDTFGATYSAVRDAVLKTAAPDAVPMLTELYNKRLANGLAAIRGDQLTEQKTLQRQTYDEGVARQTSKVALLQGSDNPTDQAEAADEHAKLSLLIRGGVNSGLYSPAEAQAMNINAMRTITSQVFETQVDRELARPDGGDVVGLLERFRSAHEANLSSKSETPVLSEPEFNNLMSNAKQKIMQQKMLEAYTRMNGHTAEELKFQAGDTIYTSRALTGKATLSELSDAVSSGNLKPETGRALAAFISNGGVAHSNPYTVAGITHDPAFLDKTDAEILAAGHGSITGSDLTKIIGERDQRLKSWEGTQAVKLGKNDISTALKIVPGALVSDDQKRALTDANNEYLHMLQSADPAQRDALAPQFAQKAIQHVHQQEAATDVINFGRYKQSLISAHGPGSAEQWDGEKLKQALKNYDDRIAAAQRAAQGK